MRFIDLTEPWLLSRQNLCSMSGGTSRVDGSTQAWCKTVTYNISHMQVTLSPTCLHNNIPLPTWAPVRFSLVWVPCVYPHTLAVSCVRSYPPSKTLLIPLYILHTTLGRGPCVPAVCYPPSEWASYPARLSRLPLSGRSDLVNLLVPAAQGQEAILPLHCRFPPSLEPLLTRVHFRAPPCDARAPSDQKGAPVVRAVTSHNS